MAEFEKRKALIASIQKHGEENFLYVYGKPDLDHLTPIVADLVQVVELAKPWLREAKQNSWKTVLAEVESLRRAVLDAISQAKRGCDPLAQGQWICELLDRIPRDILKQKLGLTSLKEMQNV